MDVQQFNLTSRLFETLSDLRMLNLEDKAKKKQWEARLFVFSVSFAKQILDEYNELT